MVVHIMDGRCLFYKNRFVKRRLFDFCKNQLLLFTDFLVI